MIGVCAFMFDIRSVSSLGILDFLIIMFFYNVFQTFQEGPLQKFFSVFYFAINAGSLISTFITPILRHDVQCFGNDCYALAFGVPAMLMFVAVSKYFLCALDKRLDFNLRCHTAKIRSHLFESYS